MNNGLFRGGSAPAPTNGVGTAAVPSQAGGYLLEVPTAGATPTYGAVQADPWIGYALNMALRSAAYSQ